MKKYKNITIKNIQDSNVMFVESKTKTKKLKLSENSQKLILNSCYDETMETRKYTIHKNGFQLTVKTINTSTFGYRIYVMITIPHSK